MTGLAAFVETPAARRGPKQAKGGLEVLRLTVREVQEKYGGILPPGATLRPDDDTEATPPRPAPGPKRPTQGKRKPNAVVSKLLGFRHFFETAAKLDPRLHPLAVAIWAWLWTCAKDGRVRTSERRLAVRFGVGRNSIRSRLRDLERIGFLELIRKGKRNQSATIYKVRPKPKTGSETDPQEGLRQTHEYSSTEGRRERATATLSRLVALGMQNPHRLTYRTARRLNILSFTFGRSGGMRPENRTRRPAVLRKVHLDGEAVQADATFSHSC